MMEYLNSNVVAELKTRLINYINILDPKRNELELLSYEELLEIYRNLLCTKGDYREFDNLISSCVTGYRENYPDSTLLDEEIMLAEDILCPINFIGLLSNKIILLSKRLARHEEEQFILEHNDEGLSEQALNSLRNKNETDRIICTNYVQKCQRIMEIIQAEFGFARERRQ